MSIMKSDRVREGKELQKAQASGKELLLQRNEKNYETQKNLASEVMEPKLR